MINTLDNIFDYYKYQKINISDLQNQNNILFYIQFLQHKYYSVLEKKKTYQYLSES